MKWTDYFDQAPALWKSIAVNLPAFFHPFKQKAADNVAMKGFPHPRLEVWRKTPLNKWGREEVSFAESVPVEHNGQMFPGADVHIRLTNGVPATDWGVHKGMQYGLLSEAAGRMPEVLADHFSSLQSMSGDVITDFNTAYFRDGLFVYVPANTGRVRLEWVNVIDAATPQLWNGRVLVIVEPGNEVEMAGTDLTAGDAVSIGTRVTEVFVRQGSVFRQVGWQQLNDDSALTAHLFVRAEANAKVDAFHFPLNGGLVREEIWADIAGCDAAVHLRGFYAPSGDQQTDQRVFVAHSAAGSYSHQQYKGLINDRAKALFNGRILVRPGAQQTNAYQKNDNILLSDDARAHSQPFLEIYADDVSCSHGSTTGSLNTEALFYMQQRGLSETVAQRLMLYGYADEVINQIHDEEIQALTRRLVRAKIDGRLTADTDVFAFVNEHTLSLTG